MITGKWLVCNYLRNVATLLAHPLIKRGCVNVE